MNFGIDSGLLDWSKDPRNVNRRLYINTVKKIIQKCVSYIKEQKEKPDFQNQENCKNNFGNSIEFYLKTN